MSMITIFMVIPPWKHSRLHKTGVYLSLHHYFIASFFHYISAFWTTLDLILDDKDTYAACLRVRSPSLRYSFAFYLRLYLIRHMHTCIIIIYPIMHLGVYVFVMLISLYCISMTKRGICRYQNFAPLFLTLAGGQTCRFTSRREPHSSDYRAQNDYSKATWGPLSAKMKNGRQITDLGIPDEVFLPHHESEHSQIIYHYVDLGKSFSKWCGTSPNSLRFESYEVFCTQH